VSQKNPADGSRRVAAAGSLAMLAAIGLSACGGGGGGGSSTPAPAVTFSANPASVSTGETSTLTWSTTNASSCTASGGWSGSKGVSGNENTSALTQNTTFTLRCTGDGGSTSRDVTVSVTAPPAPSVTLSANPLSVPPAGTSTLTWSTTNANSCTASGGWSGSKATSGTEDTPGLAQDTTFTLSCSGDGGTTARDVTISVIFPDVTVSGKISFQRVPFSATIGNGLDFANPVSMPARGVTVQIVDAGNQAILKTTRTTSSGDYSVIVPANRNIFVRARAEVQRIGTLPTYHFRVLDNTDGDALYVLDGSSFSSGTADSTHDLLAMTGWGGAGYTGTRAAAPFAILDTLYQARTLMLSAKADLDVGDLDVYWSPDNKASASMFCPSDGLIITSLFLLAGDNDCNPVGTSPTGIYLLGDYTVGDTDEFDQHVIAHEFGHFFEESQSRTDSLGGIHVIGERLDMRVAFAEGWGNAFSAMVLDDPEYRDSMRDAGGQFDIGFNIESDNVGPARGWYNEGSIHEILWDVFDPANDDGVALGFTPIFDVLRGAQVGTPALTSIYPFINALRSQNAAAAGQIDALLTANNIDGTGDYGAGESNFPTATGVVQSDVLPIYTPINLNQQLQVCGIRAFGTYNKVSNRRFLTFTLPATQLVSITVIGLPGTQATPEPDPDFAIWKAGLVVDVSEAIGTQEQDNITLDAGDYVLEVYEFSHVDLNAAAVRRDKTCMTVSITG
jgi:hypothetical protein